MNRAKDALNEISRLAKAAIDSDGSVFLSEHAVADIARSSLAEAEVAGDDRERLSKILSLAEASEAGEEPFYEADVLALAGHGYNP